MLQCIRFQNLEGFPSGVISTNEPTNYSDLMLLAITFWYTLPYDLFSIHYPPTHAPALFYYRCIMKWMEVKETCPICQRNCRRPNRTGNAERTPLLLDI